MTINDYYTVYGHKATLRTIDTMSSVNGGLAINSDTKHVGLTVDLNPDYDDKAPKVTSRRK